MKLFQQKNFISAAGLPLDWKIECDAISREQWEEIAAIAVPRLPRFGTVVGIPTGGLVIADAFQKYRTDGESLVLVVDDVWTTGKSMLDLVDRHQYVRWVGFVGFSRTTSLPENVFPFMMFGL